MKNNKTKYILLAITILWMTTIFYFSSQPVVESSAISQTITQKIVEITNNIYNNHPPDFLTNYIFSTDHFVRKTGHAWEYMILGILVLSCLRIFRIKRTAISAILICMLYAASDEFHQIFVPGRGPLVSDVALDTVAAGFGVLLVFCIKQIGIKRSRKSIKRL